MTPQPSGDLLRLSAWWIEHRPSANRSIAWVRDPADAAAAKSIVDQAVDSGATLIALLTHGGDITARALISDHARVPPTQVRDQPSGMSDIEWMREVAAIRDTRSSPDLVDQDAAITAAAAVLTTALHRRTPVVFDGLAAHAGAMVAGTFDTSWLPASSSTDPAITVAHEYWRTNPALDLHLRGDGELGLLAVFALMNVIDDSDLEPATEDALDD